MKILLTLIIALILFNPSIGLSALSIKKLLFYTEQTNDTVSTAGIATHEEMNLTYSAIHHTNYFEKVKLLKHFHDLNKKAESGKHTHFGIIALLVGLGSVAILMGVYSAAVTAIATGFIISLWVTSLFGFISTVVLAGMVLKRD